MTGRLAAIAAALLGAPAHAAAPWSTLPAPDARVDLALTIDAPAEQLASPQGRALAAFAAEIGLLAESRAAWDDLARTLAVEPQDLARLLLAQRLTALVDLDRPADLAPGARATLPETRWAVITAVEPATERLVRARLHAAPRDAVPGATILAVEGGRFRLAVVPAPDHAPALVLAPAGAPDIFRLAIDLARATPDPKRPAPPPHPLPESEIIGFARLEALAARAAPATLAWSAARTDNGWRTDLALTADPDRNQATAPALPAPTFLAIARDALAAATIDDAADAAATIRAALGTAPLNTAPSPLEGPLTLALFPSGNPDAPLAFQLAAALTTDQPHAAFDRLVATYLVPFQNAPGVTGDPFDGHFPQALRRQPVTIAPRTLARLFGTDAEVAWRYTTPADHPFAVLTGAPARARQPATDLTDRTAALLPPPPAEGAPPLALGASVRPAALAAALPTLPDQARALRWIREITLTLHQPAPAEPALRRGELLLRTDPQADPRPDRPPAP